MKTEIVWFGSLANLNEISGSDLCLPVGSDVIKPREVVRDLGVYLERQAAHHKGSQQLFPSLRRLLQIRHSVEKDVMVQLVVGFVLSRIDYCNAVLAALP